MNVRFKLRLARVTLAASVGFVIARLVLVSDAFAQEPPPPTDQAEVGRVIVTGSNMMAVFSFFRRSLRLEHHRMRMQTTAGSSTPFDWDGQRMPGASPVHLHDNRRGSPADQSIALRSIGKVEAQMWSD